MIRGVNQDHRASCRAMGLGECIRKDDTARVGSSDLHKELPSSRRVLSQCLITFTHLRLPTSIHVGLVVHSKPPAFLPPNMTLGNGC